MKFSVESVLKHFANTISFVCRGYFESILLFCLIVLNHNNSKTVFEDFKTKISNHDFTLYSILMTFLLCFIIPIPVYLILLFLGKVKDIDLSERTSRPKYYSFITLIHIIAFIFSMLTGNTGLSILVLSLFCIDLLLLIVSTFWKISGHMLFLGMFFVLLSYSLSNIKYLLLIPTALLVGWSRYYLKKHTILQLTVAFLIGTIIPIIVIYGVNILSI